MGLHKLTAGDGYTYLTRQVAAQDATHRGYDDLGAYYSEKGETPGVWMGRGLASTHATLLEFSVTGAVTEAQMRALFGEGRHPNADQIERALRSAGASEKEIDRGSKLGKSFQVFEQANMFHRRTAGKFRDHNLALGLDQDTPVPADVRAGIRSDVAAAMFRETFGRDPADPRELSGHLARISRQATTAVAGYDLTFSPVKSVSTLWAIAPRDISAQIEQAHHEAVRDTITWLEDHAAYTRTGPHGVAQVKVTGLIAAAFNHRDSRDGDPDLHTHVAISNKVQTADGRWLALDGRPLFKNNVPASERYNTRLEALLTERLGVSFAARQGTDPAKRPIREIVGVEGELPRLWSKRRASIDVRRAALSARFQADHGRPPTPNEARELAQQATLETRRNKHEPRSHADQRATWRGEAVAVLGGERRLAGFIRAALSPARADVVERQRVTDKWVRDAAGEVLTAVSASRAVWQENHIRAEAERHVRGAGVKAGDLDRAVDAVIARALAPESSTALQMHESDRAARDVPAALRRPDGASVYTQVSTQRYTSAAIIAAEREILAAAGEHGGRTISPEGIDLALIESAANGVTLNPGQAQLVRELGTSGARVQLALAPAGTGKTTAMRVLTRAWADGGGDVIGLAPSAAAAAVLREEIQTDTDTLAKLIHALETGVGAPPWLGRIGPTTLVVIDEAGMAGTVDLAKAVTHVLARGGSVRLIGDDQQLAAIGAGGALRDIAETHGAVTLSQVMRFADPETGAPNKGEGAASLALREGDPSAIAYYLDHDRVHVGDLTTATDGAYKSWSADRANGLDAIMLAPTRELVAELNTRARTDRLAALGGGPGPEAALSDGSRASVGDAIITRRNDRRLRLSNTDWVKNGDRWIVASIHDNGALNVIHTTKNLRKTLPADYVAEHVSLGYATTVHGAQGITADTCYTVATGQESRQLLYVAMTRGRFGNHLHLTSAGDGDPHAVVTRDALLPPTAGDILARILARDAAPTSAATEARALADPSQRLYRAADEYGDALAAAAVEHLQRRDGADALAAIDAAAEAARPGVTDCAAYPALRAHLALCAVDGNPPEQVLAQALRSARGLDDALDVAAVLDWRIDPAGLRSTAHAGAGSPLPWAPAVPDALARDPEWGLYLLRHRDELADRAADTDRQARAWTPLSAPPWARPFIDRDPVLTAELAVWRAAAGVDETDLRPTGAPHPAAAPARAQRALDARVALLLGDPNAATNRWAPLAARIEPRIAADPYWPTLADRFTAADRAGVDVAALAVAVGQERPLPDEQPAAALWWRLAGRLSPAAISATNTSAADTLRPAWTQDLRDVLGETVASRVLADPAWPSLVAAVTTASSAAQHDRWQPAQLLAASYDLLRSGQPDNAPLRPDEIATALVWRIAMLTDPAVHAATTTTPSSDHAGIAEPSDSHHDPEPTPTDPPAPASADDEDWLASLIQDGPAPDAHERDEPTHDEAPPDAAAGSEASGAPAHDPTPAPGRTDAAARDRAARIHELNTIAEEFFFQHYRDTWAADYVTSRLGTDLADQPALRAGYAPDRWTALTDHLRTHGADDAEIVAAGLGTYTAAGRVIDRFRDRLVFPIRAAAPEGGIDEMEIHGFIGRRNPIKTDDHKAGPKYLNTAETDLFYKGSELYGLVEQRSALKSGATPVLVEGPLDALAVTLAGRGDYVGAAPMGTAFTDAQADLLLAPYLGTEKPRVIVATDNDTAGRQASRRAFWQLTARNDDPRRLRLPDGSDPAELLRIEGPPALYAALTSAPPLAGDVIADRMAPHADDLHTVEGRVSATRRAAEVIAALPPDRWAGHLIDLVALIGISEDVAIHEILDASTTWAADPRAAAAKRIAERLPEPSATVHTQRPGPAPASAPTTIDAPTQRWAALANSLHATLTEDAHWRALARTIQRAADIGMDVSQVLPDLIRDYPLDTAHPGRDLESRLVEAGGSQLLPRPANHQRQTPMHPQDAQPSPAADTVRPPAPRR